MSMSGASSSTCNSVMAADPEDCGYEGFDEKLELLKRDNNVDELPASILRALQRTAVDMQDEELSGIMEEKIKQYVFAEEEQQEEKVPLILAEEENQNSALLQKEVESSAGPVLLDPTELQEDEISAKCEEEIQEYVRAQEQLEASPQQESSDNSNTLETPTVPSETPQSRPKPRPLLRQQQQLAAAANLPDLPLEIGDHVYQWRTFLGVPGVFQHHGIVMDINRDENGEMELKIADFSCILRAPSGGQPTGNNANANIQLGENKSIDMITGENEHDKRRFGVHPHGILRVYDESSSSSKKGPKWHKVSYRASVWKTSLWRSGTCTCVESDPPAKVLARAYFLLEHPELLPSYHIFNSNCECVAVWCKTGNWSTLQASSLLSLTAAGQLKSTATLAAYAASQQVTVQAPAAGIWGYLGYTTSSQVSLLSTQPHLIPLLAAYGVVTAGGPTLVLWRAQHSWERTSERLNERFWDHACRDPDMFANSMMYWSEKHAAFERSR